jgi:hypothetical protein
MKKIRLKGEEPYLFFFLKKGQIFLGVEALKRDEMKFKDRNKHN